MSKKRQGVQTRPGPNRTGQRARPRPRPQVRRSTRPDWVMPVSLAVGGLVVIAVIVVAATLLTARGSPSGSGSSGSTAFAGHGQTVDGIQCQTSEQVVYHIHAHLAIYANGAQRTVPMGIGIPSPQVVDTTGGPFVNSGSCFYWLHSHKTDGIIHVESPDQRGYTLGDYFDIWGEKLSASQVGSDTGTVIAYVNGQRYAGDPRQIPLTPHAVIQLDVGTDVAPKPYAFAGNL